MPVLQNRHWSMGTIYIILLLRIVAVAVCLLLKQYKFVNQMCIISIRSWWPLRSSCLLLTASALLIAICSSSFLKLPQTASETQEHDMDLWIMIMMMMTTTMMMIMPFIDVVVLCNYWQSFRTEQQTASGCVVECWICNCKVAGSNLGQGYFARRSTEPSIPLGSVNEYQLRLERQRQV